MVHFVKQRHRSGLAYISCMSRINFGVSYCSGSSSVNVVEITTRERHGRGEFVKVAEDDLSKLEFGYQEFGLLENFGYMHVQACNFFQTYLNSVSYLIKSLTCNKKQIMYQVHKYITKTQKKILVYWESNHIRMTSHMSIELLLKYNIIF